MRRKHNQQKTMSEVLGQNRGPKELGQMSLILDANPKKLGLAFADLTKGRRTDRGKDGMLTAEQVLRCSVLKQLRELTYNDLEYYLVDSLPFRAFIKFRMGQYPSKSALCNGSASIGNF